ncbi:TIGR02391 family protein [Sphingomonas baiyangensis]|uniref:TIGR02391 family protein n=1 Tax=Sphingomonas baiyangensis TaxID=2572576 RepID=A0A4V5PU92_9SPHN|nr:TIGR02391 family protein [Sphingomonas baiyangensis]TKD53138.1 TIGR02391 family protein [Sphingomonas baiyangensis]
MIQLDTLERIARSASLFTEEALDETDQTHPFDRRNIHAKIPAKVRRLFDDAHYAQSTFEASKFLDKHIARMSGLKKSGAALMQEAFKEISPTIQLTELSNISQIDEQKGYQWLFTGSVWAIRNPRGHEFDVQDDMEKCLDHLGFISMLMRRLEEADQAF